MEFPYVLKWTSPFPFQGLFGVFIFFSFLFNFQLKILKAVEALAKRRVLRSMLFACVLQIRTLGLYGLTKDHNF